MTSATPKKTILLVDDDADFVEMNKAVLEHHGYRVVAAYNGADGLAKAKAERPALIVLDVMMATRSDGFSASRDLRENEATKNTPIILVTSVNESVPYKFKPDETWLPVDVLIEKPITPERLLEEVKKRIH